MQKEKYIFIVGFGVEIIAYVLPQKYPNMSDWILQILLYFGICMILFWPIVYLYKFLSRLNLKNKNLMYIPGIVLIIVGVIWIFAVYQNTAPLPQEEKPKEAIESKKYKTLYDCFKNDFGLLKVCNSVKLSKPNSDEVTTIEYNLHMDPESNSKFVSYYVPPFPDSSKTYEIILALINSHIAILERIDSEYTIDSYTPGDSSYTYSKDLKFSGKIYIYYAGDLLLEHLGEISKQCYHTKFI